jgi:Uma2 family endonuclease
MRKGAWRGFYFTAKEGLMSTATLVPETPTVNGALPEHYEVINDRIVELPPMGALEMNLANLLSLFLWKALPEPLPGQVFVEMLFRLAARPKRDRKPDVAYVPYDLFPNRIVPAVEAWAVIPALAVEIVSKTNTASEIRAKIDDYLKYGVRLVWVVYPQLRKVEVWDGPQSVKILEESDTLDGGMVLPNFRLPLATLFAVVPHEEE